MTAFPDFKCNKWASNYQLRPRSLYGNSNGTWSIPRANIRTRDFEITKLWACRHFQSVKIFNIFGWDKCPTVCQSYLSPPLLIPRESRVVYPSFHETIMGILISVYCWDTNSNYQVARIIQGKYTSHEPEERGMKT